ncbi:MULTISPECIES: AMP-binding protein [unclassified Streptomyces]|uniref:AMP-binding protein n=1 Tax=unclassified Streptomyces TaxID=2593676 RepID=UPI000DDAAD92|nr:MULTISPECIES: AMP-binding protein [unclassified Streptomyces]QZZ27665.1 fatty acyl-AMP ligase [Streptomyces sp. ST1015]
MNLVRALGEIAGSDTGARHGLRLYRDETEAEHVTYRDLYISAGRVADGLVEHGVTPGERVAITLPTSAGFARAFFGVLAAGAVPVPLPPPVRFTRLELHLNRIALAMRQSKVRRVLSDGPLSRLIEPVLGGTGGEFDVHDVAEVEAAATSEVYDPAPAESPALIQYTSGTSRQPRGVVLSHANLLANIASITEGLDVTDQDVSCSWLPLFHDMGLIGTLLAPALTGADCLLMPPEDFLRDPGRWLRMISRHRGTATTAPNSGYLYALRRTSPEQVAELDLSSWRVALNGAEPVDPELLRRFTGHFAPAGFRSTAFLPVYGLAEGSLAVTFTALGRPTRSVFARRDHLAVGKVEIVPAGRANGEARELVSVGVPVARTEVRLVGDDGLEVTGEDRVGEIQIRGAAVMREYEADAAATSATVLEDGWVATGDIGFRQRGELFMVGRKKEMIIVFGQNYYASDIEAVAGGVPGVTNGAVLAAALRTAEGEGLALIAETKESSPEEQAALVARLRLAVSDAVGLSPRKVILLRRGGLPRTSSGKLRRHGLDELLAMDEG